MAQKMEEHTQTTPANETGPNALDPTIVEAMMTGTIRDKQILLLAESEMGKFISSNLQRQPLSASFSTSLNSYQRMLVHRLGDSFGIKRLVESNQIILERTHTSTWPNARLESLIVRQDASPSNTDANLTSTNSSSALSISAGSSDKIEPSTSPSCSNPPGSSTSQPKTFKIMSRTLSQTSRPTNRSLMPSTASSGSSTDGSASESKRNEMSYEERQAAYLEARNRIFASSNHSSTENSTGESTAGSTSSSGAGPDEDRFSTTTSNSKSKSQPESESGVGTESNVSKDKSDSTRSNKAAAKLRPSATSFDPNAKAHGYEEVTIIEVDNQSITVPYPGPNKLYPNYLAHPTAEYPNPFPSDPRLTHAPPNHYKIFPNPSYPLPGSAPSHPPYPAPSHHLSGMGPPMPIHVAPPGGMPPPFISPPYQAENSPTMSTIIAPPPPIPPIQSSNNNNANNLPPDHKFDPNNNQPFKDYRPLESGYPQQHTMRSHQTHPSIGDSSSHQHLVPNPSPFPPPLPPPSQNHHHQQQHPFNGPPPNGFVPDFKNYPPPFPPHHDPQSPQQHPNHGMVGGYPRHGPAHMDMISPNGFSTWNPSLPPPSCNPFPPPRDHTATNQIGVQQNGNGTSDHHHHQTTTNGGDGTTQASCESITSTSSCSTTGGGNSLSTCSSSFKSQPRFMHHNGQGQGHLNKSLDRLSLNPRLPTHNHNHNHKNKHHRHPVDHHHHHNNAKVDLLLHKDLPPTSSSTTTATSMSTPTTTLVHPLPPKPVWNLKNNLPSFPISSSSSPSASSSDNPP